jgi:hypothetical protein
MESTRQDVDDLHDLCEELGIRHRQACTQATDGANHRLDQSTQTGNNYPGNCHFQLVKLFTPCVSKSLTRSAQVLLNGADARNDLRFAKALSAAVSSAARVSLRPAADVGRPAQPSSDP